MIKIFLVGEGETELGRKRWDDKKHKQIEEDGVAQIFFRRLLQAEGMTEEIVFVTCLGRDVKTAKLPKRPGYSKIPSSGFAAKSYQAMLLAKYLEKCDGLIIFVDTDRDTKQDRCRELNDGINLFHQRDPSGPNFPGVAGVAIHTIEAWLLADADAFTTVCGKKRPALPANKLPEELWGDRDDPNSHHPKQVLANILDRCIEDVRLTDLAERIDLNVLKEACPDGFGTLAQAIVEAFVVGYTDDVE